jgi:MFS family permease
MLRPGGFSRTGAAHDRRHHQHVTVAAPPTPPGALGQSAMRRVVWSLCLTETVSYGVLYYAFLVLYPSIVSDTGWSPAATMLAFSLGQIVAAIGGIAIGRVIDRRGPRVVMTGGSIVAVPALCLIGLSPNQGAFVAAWILAGVAMSAVLYTPAFSAISHWGGPRALRSLTAVTLTAGFASTIFGPVTARLGDAVGWRLAFVVLAGVLAVLTVPTHWLGLRGAWLPASREPGHITATGPSRDLTRPFVILAVVMSLAVLAEYGTLAQLVPLLEARGLDLSDAALILGIGGAGQVAGRIFYMRLVARTGLVQRTVGLLVLIAVTTVLFAVVPPRMTVLLVVTTLAGAARGCVTLLLATAVPDRWGVFAIGRRNGLLSAPVMAAGALAPFLTAVLHDAAGQMAVFYAMAGAACIAALLVPFTVPTKIGNVRASSEVLVGGHEGVRAS